MMILNTVVKKKRKTRKGKGFSRAELRHLGVSTNKALILGIPIDTKRSTKHEENVETLQAYFKEMKLKLPMREKKIEIIKLIEVKGIGPKTAAKLMKIGIKNADQLAVSNLDRIADAIGSSEDRASNLIESARSILKKN